MRGSTVTTTVLGIARWPAHDLPGLHLMYPASTMSTQAKTSMFSGCPQLATCELTGNISYIRPAAARSLGLPTSEEREASEGVV